MSNGSSNEQRNEELTREFLEEVFNNGNIEAADSFMSPDFVEHSPSPGQEPGIAGFKSWLTDLRNGFPDMKMTVEQMIAKDDLVVIHIRQEGTNTGPMMGMPATGRKMSIRGADIVRISDGKAVEHWGYYEEMKMMQQLGMMPEDGMASNATGNGSHSNGG